MKGVAVFCGLLSIGAFTLAAGLEATPFLRATIILGLIGVALAALAGAAVFKS